MMSLKNLFMNGKISQENFVVVFAVYERRFFIYISQKIINGGKI
jgi:hypothetical protein